MPSYCDGGLDLAHKNTTLDTNSACSSWTPSYTLISSGIPGKRDEFRPLMTSFESVRRALLLCYMVNSRASMTAECDKHVRCVGSLVRQDHRIKTWLVSNVPYHILSPQPENKCPI